MTVTSIREIAPARMLVDVAIPSKEVKTLIAKASSDALPLIARAEKKLSEQNIQEVIRELAVRNTAYKWSVDALTEADLNTLGVPDIRWGSLPTNGDSLRFSLITWVVPHAELGDLSYLGVTQRDSIVTDEQLTAELHRLREQYAQLKPLPANMPAYTGDYVRITFDRVVNGVRLAGSDYEVELGAGNHVEGFEEALDGALPGDIRQILMRFPDDYANNELAGQEVELYAYVNSVLTVVVPDLEETTARYGCKTVDELRDERYIVLLNDDKEKARLEFEDALLDAVANRSVINLPDELVRTAAKALEADEEEDYDDPVETAIQALRRQSVIVSLVEELDLSPTETELIEQTRKDRPEETEGATDESVIDNLREDGRLTPLRRKMAERRAIEFLAGKAEA